MPAAFDGEDVGDPVTGPVAPHGQLRLILGEVVLGEVVEPTRGSEHGIPFRAGNEVPAGDDEEVLPVTVEVGLGPGVDGVGPRVGYDVGHGATSPSLRAHARARNWPAAENG